MTRLLLVGDPALLMTRVLLASFVAEARAHPEIELLGLCDAGREDLASLQTRLRRGLQQAVKEIFNKGEERLGPDLGVWKQVAKDNGLPVLTPKGRNLNDRSFHEELRRRWRPDAALSLGCLQIFRPLWKLIAVEKTPSSAGLNICRQTRERAASGRHRWRNSS